MWGVQHRISSAHHSHFNFKAEVAVKTAQGLGAACTRKTLLQAPAVQEHCLQIIGSEECILHRSSCPGSSRTGCMQPKSTSS